MIKSEQLIYLKQYYNTKFQPSIVMVVAGG